MENLGIDIKLLVAQLINFTLFFILFQKFMSKPFMNFLKKERKMAEEKENTLVTLKKQEDEMASMEQEMRSKVKKEIDQMLNQAKGAAEKAKQDILAQAQKEADQIVVKAKSQLEIERDQLYKEVKNKTVDVGMMLIRDALKDYLTDDAKKALTQHILDNVSKEVN